MNRIGFGLAAFVPGSLQAPDLRRFLHLTRLMTDINPELDRYWPFQYGCNCQFSGSDRPMSDPGFGEPVDDLDGTCKRYRNCIQCVKRSFGDLCIPEFVEYTYPARVNGSNQCKDEPNTCKRALCECDLVFSKEHHRAYESMNSGYVWYNGFDAYEQCKKPKSGINSGSAGSASTSEYISHQDKTAKEDESNFTGFSPDPNFIQLMAGYPQLVYPSNSHQCCSNQDLSSPFQLYLPTSKECCSDGVLTMIGEC